MVHPLDVSNISLLHPKFIFHGHQGNGAPLVLSLDSTCRSTVEKQFSSSFQNVGLDSYPDTPKPLHYINTHVDS